MNFILITFGQCYKFFLLINRIYLQTNCSFNILINLNMKNINLPVKLLLVCGLFTFGKAYTQDYKSIIKNYLSSSTGKNFAKTDLQNFEILNEDFSKSMNADIIKIQQTFNGIPIYNSSATALVKENKVNYYSDNFIKNYNTVNALKATLNKNDVFVKILKALNLKESAYKIVDFKTKATSADEPTIKSKLVYYNTEQNDLRLCYEYEFEEKGTSNYWDVLADANTGKILKKENLTLSCDFAPQAYKNDLPKTEKSTIISPLKTVKNSLQAIAGASYRVFVLPLENPDSGGRTLVTNPSFLDASPNGWQGDATTNYTYSRGNNVYAYEDKAGTNAIGAAADGGASYNFDFPFDYNGFPSDNLNAATTNLFYLNNKVHDIFYRLGFTETAKNFQAYNFGKGGAQNDYVLAESQDGSGKDNANFATPSDGSKPRMQMYLWNPLVVNRLFYNAPSVAMSRLPATQNSTTFGATLNSTGITGDIAISPVLDACTALPANSLSGKIGLAQRGTCTFTVKTKNLQNAGAKGAIIYNATSSVGFGGMGGTDASITIPAILIENTEGEYIKSQINASINVNATLKFDDNSVKYKDGSFDGGIITHEYGHGISNRLEPNVSCLSTSSDNEQMGEGWSDFFALMLTNKPGDNASVPRGVGNYVVSEPANGLGIRPAQYSPDFNVNNYTYGKSNDTTFSTYNDSVNGVSVEPHQIGFLWTTMLWDLHWKYVEKYGYSSDVMANTTNGSTRVLQLIVNGLKLNPCLPTFVQGRDAILAADVATTAGADRCMIWGAFAKRGLGVNASAGSKVGATTGITDQVEDFTVPSDCKLTINEVSKSNEINIYPNPAKNEFFIKVPSQQLGKLSVEVYDVSGRLVTEDKVSGSESISTAKLQNGIYIVKVKGLGVETSSKLIIKK